MSQLFSSFRLRDLTFKNRIFVSPMCQYSAVDGLAQTWHLIHLASRAVGGAALVMVEATAVEPRGRISLGDLGLWSDEHGHALAPVAEAIKSQGAIAAIQLAHAGRKASTPRPWDRTKTLSREQGAWQSVGPSAIAFDESMPVPHALTTFEIEQLVRDFVSATERALAAGFEVIELHMAHGYLLNEFLSPLSNHRKDAYGGSFENRTRFPLEVVREVRRVMPDALALFVRISATDWVENGWTIEDSIRFSSLLKKEGVDLVDCSSGGVIGGVKIPLVPGYQVPLAEAVKKNAEIATGAVGLITDAAQAEAIIAEGRADAVFMARELLRNPYWPLHAAQTLGVDIAWPQQYDRAKPKPSATS